MLTNVEQYVKLDNSLRKLNSLDKFYEKKENYNDKEERYKYKSYIISNNIHLLVNSVAKQQYQFTIRELGTLNFNDYLLDKVGLSAIVESMRIQHAYYEKYRRLVGRLETILEMDNCFFITFTFDDRKCTAKDDIKRKYVQRWLKKYCNNYVANVDFGGQNGRLHFHACVSLIKDKVDYKTWKYGAINFKIIKYPKSEPISHYIDKLCFHAIKESCKNHYLIYPKLLTTSHN